MPISPIVLQRRHAELGRIRLGAKGSKGQPTRLDKFRFTSPSERFITDIAALYGGEARQWDNGGKAEWEVYTEARSIPVVVVRGGLSQWMETWSGGGCVHRCDGVHAADTGVECDPSDPKHRAAKPTTRLSVMLPELEAIGVFRLESHGWNAAAEIPNAAELAAHVGDLVKANLSLTERRSIKDGKTSRFVVPILDLEVSQRRLLQIAEAMSGGHAELDGGSSAPQIEAPRPDYLAEVEAAGSKDDLNAVWRAASEAGHLTEDLKAAIIARAEQIEPAPEPEHVEAELMDEQPTAAGDTAAAWMAVVTLAGQHGWTTDALQAAFERELALHPSDASAEQIAAFEADLRAGRIERAS